MHDSGHREINPAFKMANKCSKVKSFDKKPNIVFFAAFVFIIAIVSRFISNRDGYPYIRNGYIQTPIKVNIQISKNSFLGSICLYHVCSQKQQSPTGTDIPQNVAHPSLRNKDTLLYCAVCSKFILYNIAMYSCTCIDVAHPSLPQEKGHSTIFCIPCSALQK